MKQRKIGTAWDLLTPAERERRLVYQRAHAAKRYAAQRAAKGFAVGTRQNPFRNPNKRQNNKFVSLYNFVVQCKIDLGECAICNYICDDYNHVCFAFDHLDPAQKAFALSRAPKIRFMTEQKILVEIAKCRLLCHVCHAIETYGNRDHDYAGHALPYVALPSLMDCPEWAC